MSKKAVKIYDTTLRDGTQGTGISFSVLDKIRDAGLFYRLIEAVARLANFTVAEMISFTDPMIERTWSNPAVVLPGDMQRTA